MHKINLYLLTKKYKVKPLDSHKAVLTHHKKFMRLIKSELKRQSRLISRKFLKSGIEAKKGVNLHLLLIKEDVNDGLNDFIKSLDLTDTNFEEDLKSNLSDIYASGVNESIENLTDSIRIKNKDAADIIDKNISENKINQMAVDFAEERSAYLVSGITDTTLQTLRDTISAGLEEGKTQKEIAKDIENSTSFNESRAETISRTEIVNSYVSGNIDSWVKSGVIDSYEWITAQDEAECEDCAMNNGEVRKFGEAFPSGALSPPEHPNCRCDLLPVVNDSAVNNLQDNEE